MIVYVLYTAKSDSMGSATNRFVLIFIILDEGESVYTPLALGFCVVPPKLFRR